MAWSRKFTAAVLAFCFSATPCFAFNVTNFLKNTSVGEGILEETSKEIYFLERNPNHISFSVDYTGVYSWKNNHHLYCIKNGKPVKFTANYLRSWQEGREEGENLEQATRDFLYAYENHIGYNQPFWSTGDIRELFVFEMLISDALSTSLMFAGQDNLLFFEYDNHHPDVFTVRMNTVENVEKFRQEVNLTNQVLKECDILMNDTAADPFEKIRRLNRFVTEKLTYNKEQKGSGNNYTEIDALCYGTGTKCAGYCNLFNLLCERYGIETKNVESNKGQESYHAWNANYINGNWYHTDTTWNDGLDDYFLLLTEEEFHARQEEVMAATATITESEPGTNK